MAPPPVSTTESGFAAFHEVAGRGRIEQMQYQDVVQDIDEMARAASEQRCDRMTAAMVARFTEFDFREAVLSDELTPPAREAFEAIAEHATTASEDDIRAALATIDAGVLAEGNMDTSLLRALEVLEARAVFLSGDHGAAARRAAWCLLESVDEVHMADLDDFLAHPDMTAAYLEVRDILAED